ncbi:THO complex subunit Tho1, putative [Talaromyces stipitatus ATCC 10500]|uniref:THO complex subunit Tho1, putative n=1 Tax=Talaromyces stipitatus (strain ATCC 10500 / CBS 375.48 / QM 6759 / NRRL 1006) TaxID=441959 RepID=B8MDV0_TALSN|nr:THO complex subunit Tho1, putative [Talaromyces stipitatus ATCC 10500]EED18329.1 THO complex subunit Tho1, putative [Talaromyces stipitatus ATCC 10500]
MLETVIDSTGAYRVLVRDLLAKAAEIKKGHDVEPPITEASLGDLVERVYLKNGDIQQEPNKQTSFAAVETAFREKFYELLASTSIDDLAFVNIWNLLDIVSIFSDNEQCEAGLIFWLIEELLDSQTVDGCRKVFDYLESRREINTAKHFESKKLIILRSCNELLRRLSRAEDTVFCGRVFIYMFQSFPLGDKSSVNLRGEFHTENVTTFDDIALKSQEDTMEIEPTEQKEETSEKTSQSVQDEQTKGETSGPKEGTPAVAETAHERKESEATKTIDLDTLYPIFWGLQGFFSAPTRLFDSQNFASFRTSLEKTLSTFKLMNKVTDTWSTAKAPDEVRRGLKRKRNGEGVDVASSFNPKYLTSRELFDLEINDIAFRRHVLVQALILLDFILSLTPQARQRLMKLVQPGKSLNKTVLYQYTVSEEDAKWAAQTRDIVADYLQQGIDGKFYYRMVDTVLSRDKNWVRWKVENCPPIEKPAIQADDYFQARNNALKVFSNKRLRASPMGSLDLTFLADGNNLSSLEQLKDPDRYTTPAPDSFMMGIVDDTFNIDMAKDKDEKEAAERAKESKYWRTLRLSSRSKLFEFELIEDGKNLNLLFEKPTEKPKETVSEDTQKKAENASESKDERAGSLETQSQQADSATVTTAATT